MKMPASRTGRAVVIALALTALWTVPSLLVTSQLVFDAGVMHRPIDPFLVFRRQLPRWWIWIPLTPLVVAFTRRVGRRILPHVGGALAASVVANASWTLQSVMNSRWEDSLLVTFKVIYPVSLNWTLATYSAIAGLTIAAASVRRAAELQRQLSEARLVALTRQLQPHFLFNTLHSVAGLVRAGRGPEAVEMIARLSTLLRETLDAEQAPEVELGREIEASTLYLDIQQTRFSDRMTVERDLQPETLTAMVPRMILQPLLENAVGHGIAASPEPGTVRIESRRGAGLLTIRIRNSGPQLPEGWSVEKFARVGLSNTIARLRQLHGERATFALANMPGGVMAELAIPWSEQ